MQIPLNSKLMLIINPTAGKNKARDEVFSYVNYFFAAGYQVTLFPTQKKGDGTEYAAQFASGYDRVVCVGGDGTLNEVVAGLMQLPEEDRPMLGYIPAGTTNDFASTLGIPGDKNENMSQIVEGAAFPCDIGRFNGQYFTYIAAFGLFTEVSYATPQPLKNALGHFAYILEGVISLTSIQSHHLTFEVDDEVIEDEFLYGQISNSTSIGGVMDIAHTGVQLDDGLFEVLLIQMPKNPLELNDIISALLMQKVDTCPRIYFRRAKHIHAVASEPTSWTLDGEDGGVTDEMTADIVPHAISFALRSREEEPEQLPEYEREQLAAPQDEPEAERDSVVPLETEPDLPKAEA